MSNTIYPKRGEIFLINLNPSIGGEIKFMRPCLVISPDELNDNSSTIIVVPMTTGNHNYPFRIPCTFAGKHGHLILDQLKAVDKSRLIEYKGTIDTQTLEQALNILQEMFAL